MEGDQPAVKTEVKIEIDVAEEPPQSWFMTQQYHQLPDREDVSREKTATIPMTRDGQAAASADSDSDTWLKKEAGEQLSGTDSDSNFNTDSQLNTYSRGAHLSAGSSHAAR
ncbi:uncharacterized protein [Littorina saxatilis]|uniref:uncharacterized protein isoform X2 n=1 Tax=Littorina saxatilis TaxID=31220 RepID=UPI0038B6A2FB